MSANELPPPLIRGMRGCLAIALVLATLVVAIFTPLGDTLNDLQADLLSGYYYPSLTFLICLVVLAVPAVILYLPIDFLARKMLERSQKP